VGKECVKYITVGADEKCIQGRDLSRNLCLEEAAETQFKVSGPEDANHIRPDYVRVH
jgi:hypothetical protein